MNQLIRFRRFLRLMFDDCVVGLYVPGTVTTQRKYVYGTFKPYWALLLRLSRPFLLMLCCCSSKQRGLVLLLSNGNIESNILKIRMAGSFWEYRHEQEALGNSNGLTPFGTKALYATVSPSIRVSFLGVPDTISHLSIVTRRWSWCCIRSIFLGVLSR
jgi:hypothetical protein